MGGGNDGVSSSPGRRALAIGDITISKHISRDKGPFFTFILYGFIVQQAGRAYYEGPTWFSECVLVARTFASPSACHRRRLGSWYR